MPEAARIDLLPTNTTEFNKTMLRKSSNMSTNSDDSLRKISSDSGISIASAQAISQTSMTAASQFDDRIGEPRLSTDVPAAVLQNMLAQQQSLTAAALNPAMLGLMSAGLGGLWGNPLAAAMFQQQEATTRKLLESANNGGKALSSSGAEKPYTKEQFPGYGNIAGLMQSSNPLADQLAISEVLRGQLLNRNLSDDLMGADRAAAKPTRKSHSFNGSSSPLNRQFSPPTSDTASPNIHNRASPNRSALSINGDERQLSPHGAGGDDDSVCSGKSSVRSRTPPPMNHTASAADNQSIYSTELLSLPNQAPLHSSQSRRRKNGIIDIGLSGSSTPDLSAYAVVGHPAFAAQTAGEIPLHKLSTASLPASLPSAAGRNSIILPEGAVIRGSPATSRKRSRTSNAEQTKDEMYWERRRKNNEAAKRSRDSRRAKEDEIAIRAAFLEEENMKLRLELSKLKEEFASIQNELTVYKKPAESHVSNGSVNKADLETEANQKKSEGASAESQTASPTNSTADTHSS